MKENDSLEELKKTHDIQDTIQTETEKGITKSESNNIGFSINPLESDSFGKTIICKNLYAVGV